MFGERLNTRNKGTLLYCMSLLIIFLFTDKFDYFFPPNWNSIPCTYIMQQSDLQVTRQMDVNPPHDNSFVVNSPLLSLEEYEQIGYDLLAKYYFPPSVNMVAAFFDFLLSEWNEKNEKESPRWDEFERQLICTGSNALVSGIDVSRYGVTRRHKAFYFAWGKNRPFEVTIIDEFI